MNGKDVSKGWVVEKNQTIQSSSRRKRPSETTTNNRRRMKKIRLTVPINLRNLGARKHHTYLERFDWE